jgi:hypothetical protein
MRSGIGSGPLRFVPLEWLSTTGRLAQLTERRQVAHSLSSKTLFPVGYQLSNATQTMVPAPPRPHLLMASSPLRTYDQDLWSLPLKPLQSGQQTGTPSNQPPNFKLMYCPSSVDPFSFIPTSSISRRMRSIESPAPLRLRMRPIAR